MWEALLAKLVSILQANTLIQEVWNYEVGDLTGNPAITIVPSANEGDYSSTTENRRTYAFTVRCFIQRGTTEITKKKADELMRALVDSVLDDFDKTWNLPNITAPTGYTILFMEAAPAAWGYVGSTFEYRTAEINVRIHTDVNVNLIS